MFGRLRINPFSELYIKPELILHPRSKAMKNGYMSDLDEKVASIQAAVAAVDTAVATDPSDSKGGLQDLLDSLNTTVTAFNATAKTIRTATVASLQQAHLDSIPSTEVDGLLPRQSPSRSARRRQRRRIQELSRDDSDGFSPKDFVCS